VPRGQHWVDGANACRPVICFVDDYVARHQEAGIEIGLKGAMRKRRVARAENPVSAKIDVELLLEGLADVDFGQDAEPLGFESVRDGGQRFVVRPFEGCL
jgi:hypothetical protein